MIDCMQTYRLYKYTQFGYCHTQIARLEKKRKKIPLTIIQSSALLTLYRVLRTQLKKKKPTFFRNHSTSLGKEDLQPFLTDSNTHIREILSHRYIQLTQQPSNTWEDHRLELSYLQPLFEFILCSPQTRHTQRCITPPSHSGNRALHSPQVPRRGRKEDWCYPKIG